MCYVNITISGVGDVAYCDKLQLDLNAVYDWASSNDMVFNSKKFSYVFFSSSVSAYKSNWYIDPAMNIIGPSTHVRDLGVSMSSDFMFDFHISNLYKRCSNLAGWILRTLVMLTLYKSLVMSRLEYASHLWSPYLLKHVYLIEKVLRAFTKHISGMCFLSYSKRLEEKNVSDPAPPSWGWCPWGPIVLLLLSSPCRMEQPPIISSGVETINIFKNHLDNHWEDHPLRYNFLATTPNRQTCAMSDQDVEIGPQAE